MNGQLMTNNRVAATTPPRRRVQVRPVTEHRRELPDIVKHGGRASQAIGGVS